MSRMRSRAFRLSRSLRGIVTSVLASPLAAGACMLLRRRRREDPWTQRSQSPRTARRRIPGRDRVLARRGSGASPRSTIDALSDAYADRERSDSIPFDGACIEGTEDGCIAYGSLPVQALRTAERDVCLVDLATCVPLCDANRRSFFFYCQLFGPSRATTPGTLLDAESIVECSLVATGSPGAARSAACAASARTRTPLGDYFASMAHLEAASVRAFRDLSDGSAAFGAPRQLSLRRAPLCGRRAPPRARSQEARAPLWWGDLPPARRARSRADALAAPRRTTRSRGA